VVLGSALALLLACARPQPVVVQHPAPPKPAKPVWPAQGVVTGAFGSDGGRPHPGIDIGILRSLTVRAAVPGRVVSVGQPRGYEGYGNLVIVRTGAQEELYAHLAASRVRVGERVRAGERIGTAGCTGSCTGTHLHFEIRRRGVAVNPMRTLATAATIAN